MRFRFGSRADGERVSPGGAGLLPVNPQVRTCPGALANIQLCANKRLVHRSNLRLRLPNCIAAMGRWSVPVGMMHVRDVRVRVALPLMAMPMRVRLPGGVICGTGMLMVFVMHVRMATHARARDCDARRGAARHPYP